jgi:hypothetical protein
MVVTIAVLWYLFFAYSWYKAPFDENVEQALKHGKMRGIQPAHNTARLTFLHIARRGIIIDNHKGT